MAKEDVMPEVIVIVPVNTPVPWVLQVGVSMLTLSLIHI